MLVNAIVRSLENALGILPERFTNTFDYTQTGNNMTHPIIWAHLLGAAWDVEGVIHVGVDCRLNAGNGVKFQPDIIGFDADLDPLFAIDYESPNSSDARIPIKDVAVYQAWRDQTDAVFPYIIVTTLPNQESPDWELRYIYRDGCNRNFRGRRDEVRANPFEFWFRYYRDSLQGTNKIGVKFVNISGPHVHQVHI